MSELLPQFPIDYVPEVVEFYDELGLLVRIEQMMLVHQIKRPKDMSYQYISGYFDGHLGLVVTPQAQVLSRVEKMRAYSDIWELAKDCWC